MLQIKVLEKKTNFLLLFISVLTLLSCETNYTKDDYLKDYERFVVDIKRDWREFNESDWLTKDKINDDFYNSKYNKFQGELSSSEKVRVQRFNFVFRFYKGDITIKSLIAGEYNNLFKDLAIEVNDIIRELRIGFNDLENERTTILIDKLLE
ncbi:DUF6565 domain-containing protein [Winogradskyella luteola]|uniref:DUF6565 domain-containing protein n=1 Tax=Winogradskyella luteola TaxID=2828330 RepID=A0A9X1F770_9FLAO|nr:DUF6565 domain-containing protein [Winogradskyella luteola]MBV7267898.1 hypothetical protein [Winogradskyella luteola]